MVGSRKLHRPPTRELSQTLRVAATQLSLMWRERRLPWLALSVLLLAGASVATNAARLSSQAEERRAVAEEEALLWDSQGVIDPHDAAHVGRAVPAPVRPLAAFDPGLSDFLGTSVFIEGHAQNPARHRRIEGGAALSRFGGFSAAWTLQIVAPLLIILAGFATMSGAVARERLRQELGAGAPALVLVGGRLVALAAAAGLLALVMIGVSVPAMLLQGVSETDVAGLGAIGGAYALYLLVFCAVTVAASGQFASARTAPGRPAWILGSIDPARAACRARCGRDPGAHTLRPPRSERRSPRRRNMASAVTIPPTSG